MRDFHLPGRSVVLSTNGMCATSHPLAAKVAVQMMEQGGNAMDAAIAAAVLLGFCEPQMTGIGGDLFALVQPAGEDRIVGLNGSGRAPAGLDAARLRDAAHTTMPAFSADAVTVPGAVDAFVRLSADWGRLGLKTALAPAIHYARAGVPVGPRTAFDWALAAPDLKGAARDFYLVDGAVPKVGTLFRAPKQAEVLEKIAMDGRAGFYEGEVADDMVNSLRALGGTHTLDDFAATACDYVEPVSGDYRGYELVELPPNGQGATAILMANILKQFDIGSLPPLGARRAHIEAEAAKLAYDARNRFMAEADAPGARLDHLLSEDTAKALAGLIDPERAMRSPAALSEQVHKDTVYLTVVDADRMAVSLIYSIFHSFGSCLASERFGIGFQNRGAGFTLEQGHPNEAGGGKRPLHTIIPAMLRKEGKLLMPFGVMGGAYQPNGHVRLLSNLVDYGMELQEAVDAPRSFNRDGSMEVERGYPESVREQLEAMGHSVTIPEVALGGAQAIWIDPDTGLLSGASDPRKDGCALGY
ncbi:gamma-glutamyltransferase family protein [Oceanomicrobium pacificus]|uniref:Gamma-glutamyltransferase n=1 Tax=Oceanomicrobium pacificus TaxID=2692916 RepID=A0A6B0TL33_9RHOB|nr:gamma-glutamyltransferase family protein [Oceanomicrobium pacificus]MXU64586.1 gamma-glutamyltransferase [Oceanomicrobium pacificus]